MARGAGFILLIAILFVYTWKLVKCIDNWYYKCQEYFTR